MNCTAHISVHGHDFSRGKKYKRSIRCEREIGHGGLHRYTHGGTVKEFDNSKVWFPVMDMEEDKPLSNYGGQRNDT